jgi:hypothetical protein
MRLNYLNLGPPRETVPPPVKILWRGVRAWWRARKGRLGITFAEAFSLHVILFAALLLTQSSSLGSPRLGSSLEAIHQALAELSKDGRNPGYSESIKDKIDSLSRALDQKVKFDDRLDKNQKVEIMQYMLRSSLRMRVRLGGSFINVEDYSTDEIQALIEQSEAIRLTSGEKAFYAPRVDGSREIEFYTLDRSREARIRRLRQTKDSDKDSASLFSDLVGVKAANYTRTGFRSVPAEVYYRECPFERILARGAGLFSIIKGFPELAAAPRPSNPGLSRGARKPDKPDAAISHLMKIIIVHSPNLDGAGPSPAAGITTEFSSERMDKILDGLMALPEGRQFVQFDRDYLRKIDPNSEELARLARRFIAANLNGVFYWTDDFSMAFDFLEELFYKRPIYDALAAYIRQHPGTKTAAEFLFCLADAYDFERRALALMDIVYDDAGAMLANRSRHTSAYDYKAKAFVLHEMADEVRNRLKSGGFTSNDAAARRYREECADLYRILESMGGETANRARFALGQLLWEEGSVRKAIDSWGRITPSYSFRAYLLIRPYLGGTGDALAAAVPKIGEILNNETTEGNGSLLRRQLKFHKWTIWAETIK